MSTKKPFEPAKLLLIWVPVVLIFSLFVYLFSKDGLYNGVQISGWEALSLEWPAFWTWAIGLGAIGVVLAIIAGLIDDARKSIVLAIIAMLLIFAPWGKGCTDKTNGGFTAPGHQVTTP